MGTDINALTTNADKLKECIDENEKQEQDKKEKDKQLSRAIERKVTKKEHKREKPRGRDSAIKECVKLLKEGANPKVLTELEKILREQEGHYKYYVECFLPVLDRKIEQSDEILTEIKDQVKQVISNITNNSSTWSQVEDNTKVETSNGIANTSAQLFKIIEKKNNSKFKTCLKNCPDISNIKNEEGKNILHLIVLLEGKWKFKFLGTLIKTATKENLIQLIDDENQGKTPLQEALINKITKGKHKSHTISSNDNTLRFLVKLLKHGAKPDQLKILQSLDKKQESYYHKFLKRLIKSVEKSELDQEIINLITYKAANIIYDGYPLHKTVLKNDKEEFSKLLRSGCNIANQDKDGNNILHLVTELGKKQKLEFLRVVLDVSQESELLKKQFIKAVNDKSGDGENSNGQTPLHQLLQGIEEKSKKSSLSKKIQNIVKKDFKDTSRYQTLELLLRNGADITAKDKEGNNALHYITSFKGEQKVACLNLILGLVEGRKIPDNRLREAMDAKNKNEKEQTPLHQLLQHMQKKSKKSSLVSFESTHRYKTLKLLLENGADITAKDKEGNNALHYIASLAGKQKVTCLDLILELSKNDLSLKAQLSEAIKTKNQEERTPLQVALIKKAEKGEHLSQKNTILDPAINYDNTTKFCARLLQNGANPDSLVLKDEKFHTDKYYLVLRNLKDYREPLQAGRKEAQELKEELEEKYNSKTLPKKLLNTAHDIGSGLKKGISAFGKYMDPASRTRELLTIIITTTVVAMAAFAFFQGQIGVGAAVSMIAIAGVICLTLTLGFNGIKKLFGDSTDKVKNFVDNDQQNLGNNSTNLATKEQQSQSKDTESPKSKMEDVSTKQHYMENQITGPFR